MRILLKPCFQTNEDAVSKMLRASRENSYSTQPHNSLNQSFRNHYPGLTRHALPPATQRFVQETFLLGSAMRKVLSFTGVDDTHVMFRCKDRSTDTWRTIRLPGVEFLRRFLQHVLPRGFHKIRYCGLWHHSKRELSSRAWLLLTLEKPTETAGPVKIANLLEAMSQFADIDDGQHAGDEENDVDTPCCPHCGSTRTRLLGQWPRYSVP